MQNWEYRFEANSKEDWLRQVEKELKGKPIDSLYREWWPGERINPMQRESLEGDDKVRLPDHLFVSPPALAETIDVKELTDVALNAKLLEALKGGVQSFTLHNISSGQDSLATIMKGVYPGMIEWNLIANEHLVNVFDTWNSIAPEQIFYRIHRTNSKSDPEKEFSKLRGNKMPPIKQFRFEYSIAGEGNWIENASTQLKLLIDDFTLWNQLNFEPKDFFDQCIFCLNAPSHYVKQLIQVRTLHVLVQNLYKTFTKGNTANRSLIEIHVWPGDVQSPEHFLIRASISALGAFLTGAASICFHHLEAKVPGFYKRIDRNIEHILSLESNLMRGADPLAGASSIDAYTRDWTARIWNNIFDK